MDTIAEKLAKIFGSGPFILFHVFWFTAWVVTNVFLQFDKEYSILTIVVSLEAIFLSLFILRAENIQSERLERKVKDDVKKSKEAKELSKKILTSLRSKKTKK